MEAQMVQINEFRIVNESSRRLWEKDRTKFIKKHQWILKADHLSEHLQKNVKLDVFNQEIVFERYMMDEKNWSQSWLINMKDGRYKNETITMSHFNGKGKQIALKTFHDLTVFGHKCYFDYDVFETATDTIYVKYDKMIEYKPVICSTTGIVHWAIDRDEEITDVEVNEETEINYLGNKSWVPWRLDPYDPNFKIPNHKKEKTQEIKKPLNLCTRKRLP